MIQQLRHLQSLVHIYWQQSEIFRELQTSVNHPAEWLVNHPAEWLKNGSQPVPVASRAKIACCCPEPCEYLASKGDSILARTKYI